MVTMSTIKDYCITELFGVFLLTTSIKISWDLGSLWWENVRIVMLCHVYGACVWHGILCKMPCQWCPQPHAMMPPPLEMPHKDALHAGFRHITRGYLHADLWHRYIAVTAALTRTTSKRDAPATARHQRLLHASYNPIKQARRGFLRWTYDKFMAVLLLPLTGGHSTVSNSRKIFAFSRFNKKE